MVSCDLVLLKNGEIIRSIANGSAFHVDGIYLSPAYSGWSHGEYSLVEAPPEPLLPEPTPEQLRAQMLDKTPREFRDILTDMGIFPHMVAAKINEIPFDIERQKALNAWEVSTYISRTDAYVDMIGVMFDKSPADIDAAWLA